MSFLSFVVALGCLVIAVNADCNSCSSSDWCVPDAAYAKKIYNETTGETIGFEVCKESGSVIEDQTTAWEDVADADKTCVDCTPLDYIFIMDGEETKCKDADCYGDNWDRVEGIMSKTKLDTWMTSNKCQEYKDAGKEVHAKYTWAGFKGAVTRFPEFCGTSDEQCKKELAVFFGHASQETGCLTLTGEAAGTDGIVADHPEYGRYKGRGILQLTWPSTYMAFSKKYYGEERCLLGEKRKQIEEDSEVLWAVGIYFFLSTPSKWHNFPDLIANGYSLDTAADTSNGFGLTNMAINGDLECGCCTGMKTHQEHRVKYFADMCTNLGIETTWDWCVDAKKGIDSKSAAYCYYMKENFGTDLCDKNSCWDGL